MISAAAARLPWRPGRAVRGATRARGLRTAHSRGQGGRDESRYHFMPVKLMSLRYKGICRNCSIHLPAGSKAHFDSDAKNVCCIDCFASAGVLMPLPPPAPIVAGVAGAGPQREYERRVARRKAQLDQKWGRFSGIAKALSDEPQSTTAWRKGADGERRLAAHLERELGDAAVMLHSRRVPKTRGDIDHLAIASSGVWVIDAKNYTGKVEVRDVGNWRTIDRRLYVNGRDRTKVVDGLEWQVAAVRDVIDPMGFAAAPVHANLLFTDSEWKFFANPIEMRSVKVLWAKKLCELISMPGPLDGTSIGAIATQLSAKLPAAAA